MALTSGEKKIVERLRNELTAASPLFDLSDQYYDGQQYLEQLGLAIPPELERFTVIVNWPRVVVDAIADRLEIKGYRLPGSDESDADLTALSNANGLPDQDLMGNLDYLVHGRTYTSVGTNENDTKAPLIRAESPYQIITERDPRTGEVTSALRLYGVENGLPRRGTLYLQDETISLEMDVAGAEETERDGHGLGVVPIVPTFRRRRTALPQFRRLQGVSAMTDVIPMTDSAARDLTNAQVAQETHAVPARGVIGATKGDFVDTDGNMLPQWAAYFGSVWALQNKDAKTFQFDSSDMGNFERMVNLYARLASGLSGLPPNYFGLAADDAASADAIRSREARLVKIAERDQTALGMSRARVMQIAMRIRDGAWSDDLRGLETLWYDAGTPTVAARTDAVVKMYTATDPSGLKLMPRRMAWEELGWSPTKMDRAEKLLADEERDPYLDLIREKNVADVPAAGTVVST